MAKRRSSKSQQAQADETTTTTTMTTPASASATISDEEIRERAYRRYLERGGGHGMDFDDWLEAERELKTQK